MNLLTTQDGSQVSFSARDTVGNVSPPLQGTPGFFTDGNPAVPQPASEIPGYWLNEVAIELYNLLLASGITPSDTDNSQIYRAILALRRIVDTGAANAMVGSPASALLTGLPVPLAQYPDGFTVMVIPAASNTAVNPTFAFNGGSAVAITDPLGAVLQPLDIQAGVPCELMKMGGASPFWALLRRASHRLVLTQGLTIGIAASGGVTQPTLAQILAGTASFNNPTTARNWAQQNLDLAGQTATFNITGGNLGIGLLANGLLVGQAGPAGEVWNIANGASNNVTNGTAFQFLYGAQATLQAANGSASNVAGTGSGGSGVNSFGPGSFVQLGANLNFGACGAAQIGATLGGGLNPNANYTISGAAQFHADIHGSPHSEWTAGLTVTVSGTPAFSIAFVQLDELSRTEWINTTFSGSATGKRFNVIGNSVLDTGGSSQSSYFPGNSAGTLGDNSIYQ